MKTKTGARAGGTMSDLDKLQSQIDGLKTEVNP